MKAGNHKFNRIYGWITSAAKCVKCGEKATKLNRDKPCKPRNAREMKKTVKHRDLIIALSIVFVWVCLISYIIWEAWKGHYAPLLLESINK